MPNHLAAQSEEGCEEELCDSWRLIPDDLLLFIFSYLKPQPLMRAAQVNRQWYRVALDESLWKDLLYRCWGIARSIPRAPGKSSWLSEFKRLHYRTPMVESEVIQQHRDQVLHVAFSHNGKMFSTCSKDGYVKVWNTSYPVSLKYYADMRELTWKYTQLSQFNETDTLLLVSGVHFGSNSTSGEIVVFNLDGKFELQCRVLNKPYDVFGTWYSSEYLLSGSIHWQGNYTSCSALWLNKASQALESEHESVVMRLYKFLNVNASSIRTIMIANCPHIKTYSHVCQVKSPDTGGKESSVPNRVECSQIEPKPKSSRSAKRVQMYCEGEGRPIQLLEVEDSFVDRGQAFGTIKYKKGYRDSSGEGGSSDLGNNDLLGPGPSIDICDTTADFCDSNQRECSGMETSENFYDSWTGAQNVAGLIGADIPIHQSASSSSLLSNASCYSDSSVETASISSQASSKVCQKCSANLGNNQLTMNNKYLIFTMGTKTYTPHQIGIKLISQEESTKNLESMITRKEQEFIIRHTGGMAGVPQDMAAEPAGHWADPDQLPGPGGGHFDGPHGNQNPEEEQYETVDHLIELHGHIIGMCLSQDHRYLYVNSRPWPKNYVIEDPLLPPPIAQEIDIHVIDLISMEEVGTMHRAHKAYTPNDECFFIFLDVCKEYVASGAENHHGYLWDRHYGVCLTRYPHNDVVNCVAFNPKDPEILVTASDDHMIKIWRSRHHQDQLTKKSSGK